MPAIGRPRDARIDAAALSATRDALADGGYASLSFEDVARRAGTTKPALYRRWPSRPRLALAALGEPLARIEAPDTGCTLCDLDECLQVFVAAFARIPPDVTGPLLADCAADPDLRAAFMTTLFDPPRAAVARTLRQARDRGDLHGQADLEIALDLLAAFVHYRVLFGHAPITPAEIERTCEALLRGSAADFDALLEHSRRSTGGADALHHLHAAPGG